MQEKPTLIALGAAVCLLTVAAAAWGQDRQHRTVPGRGAPAPAADPIVAVGHGAFFDADGRPFVPTAALRRDAQRFYLKRLKAAASPAVLAEFAKVQRQLGGDGAQPGIDEVVADSFLIHWLIEQVQPADQAQLMAKNTAIRLDHLAQSRSRPSSMAAKLALDDLFLPPAVTDNNGQAYIDECRRAGVPIPPTWGTAEWSFEGSLSNSELFISGPAEVHSYESSRPDGICVALPRISGDTITLLGIICLNRTNGNTCFWDRASTPVGDQVPLSGFIGGTDLTDVCSDCHAGENPFVVHPGTALDLGAKLHSNAWHNPIVKASWPQNPGPDMLLPLLSLGYGDASCTTCHTASSAGRFPQVSTALPGYCNVVLKGAIAATMPPGAPGDTSYQKHMDALTTFCAQRPPDGGEVPGEPYDDDPSHLSPPLILGPLYNCAQAIEVGGAILHADVNVFIDGVLETTVTAVNPNQQVVPVPPLVAGQIVTATQIFAGLESQPSLPETVRDHTVDYPKGLPAPEIDPPLIYDCGRVIAVRHLQGAEVTVYTNGGNPASSGSTSGDWTNVKPGISPFSLNDTFTAEYQICDDTSPLSAPESAVAAPADTPKPQFDPPAVYAGQELITLSDLLNGARTEVRVTGFGPVADFATAVSWKNDIDIATPYGGPLLAGDVLSAESQLCSDSGRTHTNAAEPCTSIPAPEIQQPFAEDTFVVVTESIPGARILVFDDNGVELGDAAGTTIHLNRALVGSEKVAVRQQVGVCFSAQAYQVTVLCYSSKQGC